MRVCRDLAPGGRNQRGFLAACAGGRGRCGWRATAALALATAAGGAEVAKPPLSVCRSRHQPDCAAHPGHSERGPLQVAPRRAQRPELQEDVSGARRPSRGADPRQTVAPGVQQQAPLRSGARPPAGPQERSAGGGGSAFPTVVSPQLTSLGRWLAGLPGSAPAPSRRVTSLGHTGNGAGGVVSPQWLLPGATRVVHFGED